MQADTPNLNVAGENAITLIEQVNRQDVIKMLERASTRLFHRQERTHAAEIGQAVLYLRQDAEHLLNAYEHDVVRRKVEQDFAGMFKARLAGSSIDFQRDDAPVQVGEAIFLARRVQERVTYLNQQLWDTQKRLKRAQDRLAKASKTRKRRR